ncbi:MAG TPA: hypothetical protein VEH79_00300, partial [Gaiellaceae bacterium]|nr:hypothetical protein [Gaiellaceae bacterium]
MATTKRDHRAEKERKQKIILAVGGLLLVGVVALQAPKLLNHFKSAPAAAPATTPGLTTPGSAPATTPTDTTGGTTTATPAPAIPVATPTKYSAQVAGVAITPAAPPVAIQGQLFSFSRFKLKDPFVQQVNLNASSSSPGGGTTTASPGGGPTTAAGGTGPQAAAPGGPLTNATLLVNGRPQRLVLHQLFPKGDPMFVLVKLTKDTARIGVAGGAFTKGNTLVIQLGKPVTLMNTTTGQRYVVKLVYTGLVAEDIAGFKAPAQGVTSGSTTTAVPGATQATNPTTVPAPTTTTTATTTTTTTTTT